MKKLTLLFCCTMVIIGLLAGPVYPLELFEPVEVEYSTYLGGTGGDEIGNKSGNGEGGCIAVDSNLCAYVIGSTSSTDFPTENPYQAGEVNDDAFISKLGGSGSVLLYSTFLGGYSHDSGEGITVDRDLCAYVIGSTGSGDFPTVNPYQSSSGGGNEDAFVAKLTSTGSELIYSTFLGGDTGYNPAEFGYGIAVDSSLQAYVTGFTGSNDFPTVNPYQSTPGGGGDAFVAKFDSTGSALIFSTYLGGNSDDTGCAVAVDESFQGCAYITGDTSSTNFPTKNCVQAAFASNDDAFVTKFNTSGSSLTFSTYLGGDHFDGGKGIAVDSARNIYITGDTISGDFPTKNAYQATLASAVNYDAFVTKINSPGSPIAFSTYLGGSEDDAAWGIAVYLDAFPYITGETNSTDFPVRNSYQSTFANQTGGDAFVAKFCCKGQTLLFSTYFGGNNSDVGKGIAVDFQGSAYIGGTTYSDNLPVENPYQASRAGSNDGFITKFFQPSLSPVYQSGDYNGDGTSDIAIFRPSSGLWAIRDISRLYFGSSTDRVVPGDYNGDGTSDVGIFRPTSGLWAISGVTRIYYGSATDQPVPSDYDGDGRCDIGVFRSATGLWAIDGLIRTYFGTENDTPVPGDYNGDGTAEVGIFRPQVGLWSIKGVTRAYFGGGNDQVVAGDYDGNGARAIGIFRPGNGLWAIRGVTRDYFGSCEDQAVPADFNGDGFDDFGIFRPSIGLWAINGGTRAYFGGTDDIAVTR